MPYIHEECLIFFTAASNSSDARALAEECTKAMPEVSVVVREAHAVQRSALVAFLLAHLCFT